MTISSRTNHTTGQLSIQVIDITGKQLLHEANLLDQQTLRLNTQNLKEGMYFIQVLDDQTHQETLKLIINR